MSKMRAKLTKGRLVHDEPTDLPEGTALEIVLDEEGDDGDDTERAVLDAAISRAWEQIKEGLARPAEDVLRSLRDRR